MNHALQQYGTRRPNSGVTHFILLPQAIAVLFRNGTAYLYTADLLGTAAVNHMHQLAAAGQGLSTYISQHIGDRYTQKLSASQVQQLRNEASLQNN